MKQLLITIYALLISAAILVALYFVNPLVIEYPKISLAILLLLLLTSFGAGARSALEMALLMPMAKLSNGNGNLYLPSSIVYSLGMLIAIIIPWLNGVSAFNVWNWIASIGFTFFNFETFYAFVGATLRMYNSRNEIG